MGHRYNNNDNNYDNQYYDQNGQYYDNQYYDQNGQYYNDQYNQGYNQSKKSNDSDKLLDKTTIIWICVLVGILVIALVAFFVIQNNNGETEPTEIPVENDNRVVGNETVGYVTIPSDWLKFQDVNGTRGVQYSDKDGEFIITLDALATSQLTAQAYAATVSGKLEQENVSQLTTSTVNLAGYTAYQVYGYYDKYDIWLVVWCFETGDGYTHYIGIEGPDSNSEYFNIPNTFKLK